MARIHFLLLLLGVIITAVSASSAPTFCKCTCFKNSTIIPLGPESVDGDDLRRRHSQSLPLFSLQHDDDQDSRAPSDTTTAQTQHHQARSASASCSECTKAFCLSQGIDFCKDAEEDDVVTMCFQRDSNKDKIIVWAFMVGTSGLLGWALFKRVREWRQTRGIGGGGGGGRSQQDGSYQPVGGVR